MLRCTFFGFFRLVCSPCVVDYVRLACSSLSPNNRFRSRFQPVRARQRSRTLVLGQDFSLEPNMEMQSVLVASSSPVRALCFGSLHHCSPAFLPGEPWVRAFDPSGKFTLRTWLCNYDVRAHRSHTSGDRQEIKRPAPALPYKRSKTLVFCGKWRILTVAQVNTNADTVYKVKGMGLGNTNRTSVRNGPQGFWRIRRDSGGLFIAENR